MATAMDVAKQNDENLETYCLIWLDAAVNSSKENINAQQKLRATINHLLTFEEEQQCLHHIDSLPTDDRIVLIVSGKLGRMVVPKIIQFRQIISAYVYCMDKKGNEEWALKLAKVKGVHNRLDDLIQQIHIDHSQQQQQLKIDEPLPISVFKSGTEGDEQSSTGLNGQFIHSQLLIDSLIRMRPTSNEKQELVKFCKKEYKSNPAELKIIEEFEQDYTLKNSLWWYTRNSFLYRLLNKALRIQNIDLLYLFRFIIRDLRTELENNKCSSMMHVYRAQRMSKEELETLQKSVGEYISMNSFFSTSINRQQARTFSSLDTIIKDVHEIFFEIDADPDLENIKPFSNITLLSYYPEEKEVLFMAGSIFRLVDVKQDSDGVWSIRMTLCSENDSKLQPLLQHMKKELGSGETNLLHFGTTLYDMGRIDHAEKYIQLYLDSLPINHCHITRCYQAFGMIADKRGDTDSSLKWYNKALEIEMKNEQISASSVSSIYNCIAIVHRKKGEYTLSLRAFEKSLAIRVKIHGKNHPDVAMCLNNIGGVCHQDKEYAKALQFHQKALVIYEKYYPADHPHIGALHNNIGTVYQSLGDYEEALKHFNIDLNISRQSLPSHHPGIAMTLENIGLAYAAKGDLQRALTYFKEASKIFRQTLSSTHPSVLKIDRCIERVLEKMK